MKLITTKITFLCIHPLGSISTFSFLVLVRGPLLFDITQSFSLSGLVENLQFSSLVPPKTYTAIGLSR